MAAVAAINRKTLFAGEALQIGFFGSRPVSDACGDVERQSNNVVVLPFSGVFAKHDAPGHHVVGTPSHAVFIAADTPFRISFPGAVGDRALILRFGEALAPDARKTTLAPHGLLGADAMMLRNALWAQLQRNELDELEIETRGLELLDMSLGAMRLDTPAVRAMTRVRWARAIERVKEAVAMSPARKWTIENLAQIASFSPFHLCRAFRQMTGLSIYDYVLRERLGHSLTAVLDGDDGLTTIALDAGFASHSHFTARFRDFFGCTPATLRRRVKGGHLSELRKIVTA